MNAYLFGDPNQPGGWIYKAASSVATMVADIRGNVDASWGAGVNTVELPNGWRYNGHPAGNFYIRHFIAAYGYNTYDSTIYIADPVSGAPGYESWQVPPYAALDNSLLYNFINQPGGDQRGYSY